MKTKIINLDEVKPIELNKIIMTLNKQTNFHKTYLKKQLH